MCNAILVELILSFSTFRKSGKEDTDAYQQGVKAPRSAQDPSLQLQMVNHPDLVIGAAISSRIVEILESTP